MTDDDDGLSLCRLCVIQIAWDRSIEEVAEKDELEDVLLGHGLHLFLSCSGGGIRTGSQERKLSVRARGSPWGYIKHTLS